MRRPKPSPEAIAAAVQAIQSLGVTADSEDDLPPLDPEESPSQRASICQFCGRENRAGNLFCGMCGASTSESTPGTNSEPGRKMPGGHASDAQHHYHHHYHHHYIQGGQTAELLSAGATPRQPISASPVKEASKLRTPLGGAALSRTEAALRQMTQEWALACNNKQLDDVLTFYAADALVLRPNIPAVRGMAAIREFFFAALDSGMGDIEVEPLRVELLGDVAYEAGRCKMLVPFAVGKRREERGKYVVVFTKQGNDWKAVVDSWSSDLSLKISSETDSKTSAPSPPVLSKSPRRL